MLTVYRIDLEPVGGLPERLRQVLSPPEKNRASRFARPELRDRFEAAHAALRAVLGIHTGVEPESIAFETIRHGKPVLSPGMRRLDVDFSLSHSADIGCIAVSTVGPLGVDVEVRRHAADDRELLGSILSAQEARVIEPLLRLNPEYTSEVLLRCWTMKEAVMKASGDGLYVDPPEVRADADLLAAWLAGRVPVIAVTCPDAPRSSRFTRWWARRLDLSPHFAAIATTAAAARIEPQVHSLTVPGLFDRFDTGRPADCADR
jgi:phosphopantetheinyl transferase